MGLQFLTAKGIFLCSYHKNIWCAKMESTVVFYTRGFDRPTTNGATLIFGMMEYGRMVVPDDFYFDCYQLRSSETTVILTIISCLPFCGRLLMMIVGMARIMSIMGISRNMNSEEPHLMRLNSFINFFDMWCYLIGRRS